MIKLGSKTAIKILKILLENPLQEFKEFELIKKAKVGKGSAGKFIDNSIKENLFLEKRIGKTKLISLNLFNSQIFLLKNLFDQEKLFKLSKSKLSSIFLFKNEVENNSSMIIIFGSTIAGTATKKSDIDLLIVSDNLDRIEEARKKYEELFGERFNLHSYDEREIIKNINSDKFIQNALIKGVIVNGYDFGNKLFRDLREKKNIEDRLFYFHDRIRAALRNYLNKDYASTKEILNKLQEQVIFYLLTERNIPYSSKKDAYEAIKKMPEGKTIQRINKVQLKQKINLMENLISQILQDNILESEGYVK